MQYDLVIIGSGVAGYSVAKEWRKLNEDANLAIITKDSGDFYSKPMLSNVLKQNKIPQDLCMNTAEDMATTLNAKIFTNCRVTKLETAENTIFTDQETIHYKQCILALGADTLRPPFTGSAVESVFHVNNLEDYAGFYKAVCEAEVVAIIGSGLVGCEFTNDILTLKKRVDVLSMEQYPLARLVVPEVGKFVEESLEKHGAHWHWNSRVVSIDNKDGKTVVAYNFENELRHVTADVVLSAVGLQANTSLAIDAGIKCDAGGIIVNQFGQTNIDNVYAIGDCANICGFTACYIPPILNASKVIAQNLEAGKEKISFPIMPIVVKTPMSPVACLPLWREAEGKWQVDFLDNGICATFIDNDGHTLAFALTDEMVGHRRELIKHMDPKLIYGFA